MNRRPSAGAEDDVLANAPEYAAWLQEGDALRTRSDRLARQITAAQAAQAKATAAHAAAVTAAVRSGEPIPETPSGVDFSPLNRASDVQRADEQSHRDRRAAVVASVAGEVLVKCRARERDRMEPLVAIGARLDELEAAARRDAFLVRDLLGSEDQVADVHVRPTRADRVPTPDVVGMLDAAKAGRTLLDPAPMPPRNLEQAGMILIDRSHQWQQHGREPDLRGLGS